LNRAAATNKDWIFKQDIMLMRSHNYHHTSLPTMKTNIQSRYKLTAAVNHLTACTSPDCHQQLRCRRETREQELRDIIKSPDRSKKLRCKRETSEL